MQSKQLIIFDMDGTLIDSGNVISNTINFVRSNIGLDLMPKEELLSNLNNPDINSAKYFYGTQEFTAEQTELFTHYYDKHCVSDIILYDGVLDMLDELSLHFTMTVATNASKDFAQKMITHLNIDNYFDLVVGASCVENPKPHPDMLLKTLKNFNLKSEDALLVGDSHKDKRAADAAKMDNILVNWGFTHHEEDKVIQNMEELTQKLLKLK
jgi:phosphoglycolate phosphatase